LQNSRDVLYIVISFCVLLATAFLCWMFYYAGKILKDMDKIMEEFRARLQGLTDAVSHIRGKVENMSSLLALAVGGAGGFVKKIVKDKANAWLEKKSDDFNATAKEAVDRAVEATAGGMKRMAKKIKK